ncbi:STT3 domain-containing protein [Campylobacter concisus]|uniref:STT3 domain-containing protein n=1 Tax=Campylobacter concisus TaxID=199 RepID=UPI000D33C7E0|nr:STT3 domain-containing protein [Campylobacter concisus]
MHKVSVNCKILLIFLAAYLFGFAARMLWVLLAKDMPEFYFNGEFMLTTNDAYYYAEGARDMLAGFHQQNDFSPFNHPISTIVFYICKIFPFKIESVMFYMSVFLAPLIALPVVLISNEFKALKAGAVAAFMSVILPSYLSRTSPGYFDSDMLNVTFALFIIYFLIRFLNTNEQKFIVLPGVLVSLYLWWYQSSYALILSIFFMFLLYTLVFMRDRSQNYQAIFFMFITIVSSNVFTKDPLIANKILILNLAVIALFFSLFCKYKNLLSARNLAIFLTLMLAIFIYFGGFDFITSKMGIYVFKGNEILSDKFHFINEYNYISEVKSASPLYFIYFMSGNILILLAAIIGYLLLCLKFRPFLLTLPMLGLGLLSFFGGVRFVMYVTPLVALGFGYFLHFFLNLFDLRNSIKNLSLLVFVVAALAINLDFAYSYRPKTVISRDEAVALDELKKITKRDDYVFSWWDYGYAIRYFADVMTLNDPGRQGGENNYFVSLALRKDEAFSARLTRVAVTYNGISLEQNIRPIDKILKDYNTSDVNTFLSQLESKNFTLPAAKKDIFYYLVPNMIDIVPNIFRYSYIDITTGKRQKEYFYHVSALNGVSEAGIDLGDGYTLPTNEQKFIMHNSEKIAVKSFYKVKGAGRDLRIDEKIIDENAKIYVIFLEDYARILLLDENTFNSSFVQLFIFERADERYFEPFIISNGVKIYRLKI